jgi:hypothetical protein
MCDKEVSIDENFNAAKLQKPDKSPGDDGISSEFYKLFWYLIGDDFVSVVKDNNDLIKITQKTKD